VQEANRQNQVASQHESPGIAYLRASPAQN
jgi:hypothetical protein